MKRECGIVINVMRYFYFSMSVIRARTPPLPTLLLPLGLCLRFLQIVSRTFIRKSALYECEEDCEDMDCSIV